MQFHFDSRSAADKERHAAQPHFPFPNRTNGTAIDMSNSSVTSAISSVKNSSKDSLEALSIKNRQGAKNTKKERDQGKRGIQMTSVL